MTVISADLIPADSELDAMEIDLLAAGTTDCDFVIPEGVEIEDADRCAATVLEGSGVIELRCVAPRPKRPPPPRVSRSAGPA